MKKILILILMAFIAVSNAKTQNLTIDLKEGTLNGISLCGYPLDSLTDNLGRPSSINDDPFISKIFGIGIKYHHLGLEFQCKLASESSKQEIQKVIIYGC